MGETESGTSISALEEPAARELVADEEQRHAHAEDRVDHHGDDRHADRETQGVDDVGVLEDPAEVLEAVANVFFTTSASGHATRKKR